jgi:hypothetical protein
MRVALRLPYISGADMTFAKIRLYCPKCLDEVKLDAGKLSPDNPVSCGSCKASLKAGELSTSQGQSFTKYALQRARVDITLSGQAAWR